MIAALAALPANAQTYPDRPVKIVLPFGAGGVADVSSRIIAEKLGERLGQRFVIENMPGAGGISAAKAVLSAPPDGYTLGLVTNGTAISAAIFNKLPFDPVTEFDMISTLGTFDLVFAVNAGSPYKTLAEFVSAAKAAPGKLNVGTVNVGGTQHLGAELLKTAAAINVQIVPFRNSPDIVVGLLRDDVHMMVDFPAAVKGQVDDGKLAPARDLRAEALALHAEPRHRRGGGRRGLRGHVLERRVRAARHAAARRQHGQCDAEGGSGDARREAAPARHGHRGEAQHA